MEDNSNNLFDTDTMNTSNLKTMDISNIQNDFIYKIVDYYLHEVTLEKPVDITDSINNLIDTLMSYYLIAKQNGVIDINNSRKLLAIKLGKDPSIVDDNILTQFEKLNIDFLELEKVMINDGIKQNSEMNQIDNNQYDIPEIDNLLSDHKQFMLDVTKKKQSIKPFDDINHIMPINEINQSDSDKQRDLTPVEMIDKITILENKLKADIKMINTALKQSGTLVKNPDIISHPDIDNMSRVSKNRNNLKLGNEQNETNQLNQETQSNKQNSDLYAVNTNTNTDRLDEAYQKLSKRLNTPLVNLVIAIIVFRFISFLFGF
jgi:hypothetical protein